MKIVVVFAHPSAESFNHALLEAFLKGVKKAGHEYELIDLYRDGFNPVLADVSSHSEPGDDVKAYQEKIKAADCLAFIFPIFWFRAPAMLEGFFDRVLTAGFAFKYVNSMPKGLLKAKKAVVIETYGGPGFYYKLLMHRIPWRRFRSVLTFCDIKIVAHQPCYNVPFTKDEVRKKYLEKVRRVGEGLK
ncbi:NAD(P)H-dependent oxidoreductase [Patescibacteria group bacterium]|nr:NAD(P)H-dependent oxidoreductase [Patescibacteria group bacterium]MBU1682847.1 NAD(P)H-dependent oxidoreductase [Patescibacteria group bacterium]